jgi:hypothetical protein
MKDEIKRLELAFEKVENEKRRTNEEKAVVAARLQECQNQVQQIRQTEVVPWQNKSAQLEQEKIELQVSKLSTFNMWRSYPRNFLSAVDLGSNARCSVYWASRLTTEPPGRCIVQFIILFPKVMYDSALEDARKRTNELVEENKFLEDLFRNLDKKIDIL